MTTKYSGELSEILINIIEQQPPINYNQILSKLPSLQECIYCMQELLSIYEDIVDDINNPELYIHTHLIRSSSNLIKDYITILNNNKYGYFSSSINFICREVFYNFVDFFYIIQNPNDLMRKTDFLIYMDIYLNSKDKKVKNESKKVFQKKYANKSQNYNKVQTRRWINKSTRTLYQEGYIKSGRVINPSNESYDTIQYVIEYFSVIGHQDSMLMSGYKPFNIDKKYVQIRNVFCIIFLLKWFYEPLELIHARVKGRDSILRDNTNHFDKINDWAKININDYL